jgi:hypothetical protein
VAGKLFSTIEFRKLILGAAYNITSYWSSSLLRMDIGLAYLTAEVIWQCLIDSKIKQIWQRSLDIET